MKNSYFGHEVTSACEMLAHKTCALLTIPEVDVRWEASVPTAQISSSGYMMLRDIRPDAKVSRAVFVRYCGYVVHELLHMKYTDFTARGNTPYLQTLHNAVEDAWIEHSGIDAGLTGNIAGLLGELIEGMVQEALAESIDWTDPRQYPFAVAVYLRRHATTKVPVPVNLIPAFDKAARDVLLAQSSHDTLRIARDLLRAMQLPPQPDQPKGPEGKPCKEGKPEAGDKPQDGKPQDGKGQPGKGEGEGKVGDQGEEGTGSGAGGNGEGKTGQTPTAGPSKAPTLQDAGRSAEPVPDCGDGAGGIGSYSGKSGECGLSHFQQSCEQWCEQLQVPGKLRRDVRVMFDSTDTDEWSRRTRRGTFDVAQAHAVKSSANVFKRHREEAGTKSAVTIVIDLSGSMAAGNRTDFAGKTAMVLNDVLTKAGVETMIFVFGSRTALLKDWNTSKFETEKRLHRLKETGATNDYHAIRMAHTALLRRDTNRRVCFVLTDGNGDVREVKATIAHGEACGITTIGVGIQYKIDHVYPKNVTVWDLKDLGTTALDKIKLAA